MTKIFSIMTPVNFNRQNQLKRVYIGICKILKVLQPILNHSFLFNY
jgi:hypothetical protein